MTIRAIGEMEQGFYHLSIESHVKDRRKECYNAIAQSHVAGNSNPFVAFMLKMIDSSLKELMQNASIYASNSIYAKKLLSLMPVET